MYDIITRKKQGQALLREEIEYFISGYTDGRIPDYQASALLMAICLRGMDDREAADLTGAMMRSGDLVDLSDFGGATADKHSTGGVGDKTTLIVAPLAAALGCTVAKMSGRGLGPTGGTVDKLEAIPGYRTSLSPEEFADTVRRTGLAVVGQSGNLAPADKRLYALRDVTATVDSIPLIASSIMSKKLASGAMSIVLDVKVGSGAFMKTEEEARRLAGLMISIGRAHGRRVRAVLSDMDVPLGSAIGNALEVEEAITVLRGGGCRALRTLSVTLAAQMASLALGLPEDEATARAEAALADGTAFQRLCDWIGAQGGDTGVLWHPERLPRATHTHPVLAREDGYLTAVDADAVGRTSVMLGAGRAVKEDVIDPSAGIRLVRRVGDKVKAGEPIALLLTSAHRESLPEAAERMANAATIGAAPPPERPIVLDILG